MSLRSKIVLILLAVVGVYAVADQVGQRWMVSRSFTELERSEAVKDLERAVAAVGAETAMLAQDAEVLASWRGTARFLAGEEPEFAQENLGADVLASGKLDLLYLCDAAGSVRWGRIEAAGGSEPIALRDFPAGGLPPSTPLLALPGGGEGHSGLTNTERGPMFVASHRVRAESGEELGTVVLGRFMDGGLAETLGERVHVRFGVSALEESALAERERELFDTITASDAPVVDVRSEEELRLYTTLADIRLAPTLLLWADIERDVTSHGFALARYSQVSTMATALLILFVLLRLLQRIVLRPLAHLTSHAVAVGQTDDTSSRLELERTDEIGLLSTEFDRMLDKLADSRAQNIKTARRAGMSEIATGVLHNVGNVLNSVNTSANLVTKRTQDLSLTDLQKLVSVLEKHRDDLAAFVTEDKRGKHLFPFLQELGGALEKQRRGILEELESLRSGVDHIAELVRSQQSYAGKTGSFERGSLETLLEDALKISRQAMGGSGELRVERDFEPLPEIPLDRHKVMEILVNLLHNARQAMGEAGQQNPTLRLSLRRTQDGKARLAVEDNGPGISPENLSRVFAHGFTTKPDGHGFGLHVSANAATEMGGSLTAESDGPGCGATFVLELPLPEVPAELAA